MNVYYVVSLDRLAQILNWANMDVSEAEEQGLVTELHQDDYHAAMENKDNRERIAKPAEPIPGQTTIDDMI